MATPKPTLKHHVELSDKKKLEDFEVLTFLEEVAPGLKQFEIANILGVHRNAVGGYVRDGMPVNMARALLGWRCTEIMRQAAEMDKIRKAYDL